MSSNASSDCVFVGGPWDKASVHVYDFEAEFIVKQVKDLFVDTYPPDLDKDFANQDVEDNLVAHVYRRMGGTNYFVYFGESGNENVWRIDNG